jgi:hypothetical protein
MYIKWEKEFEDTETKRIKISKVVKNEKEYFSISQWKKWHQDQQFHPGKCFLMEIDCLKEIVEYMNENPQELVYHKAISNPWRFSDGD